MLENNEYRQWIDDLKKRIRGGQIKAAVKVNSELIRMYWEMGADIVERELEARWGSGFFAQLSKDLRTEFPNMDGFSETNLRLIKRFFTFYNHPDRINRYQLGTEIETLKMHNIPENFLSIPWRHHVEIFRKSKCVKEALFYINKTIENGWSRAMLMNFMDADLYTAQGKVVNNFSRTLPDVQGDLARETLKDPYNFDFLTLREGYMERELEDALTENITRFLLELGQGFAYVGRQVPVIVGEREFFLDLLFYHLELRCYVVVELKTRDFEAEYTGKLGLYVTAINHQRKKETDNPTIGLLICKTRDNVMAEYSLEGSKLPIGISEYHLSKLLPEDFKSNLPSIQEIEDELKNMKVN